jgi:hypothetical protein
MWYKPLEFKASSTNGDGLRARLLTGGLKVRILLAELTEVGSPKHIAYLSTVGSAVFKMPGFAGVPAIQRGVRMPRPRNPFPTPRCHKGAAVVDVYDGPTRRTITLGPWGSEQADQEYARLVA